MPIAGVNKCLHWVENVEEVSDTTCVAIHVKLWFINPERSLCVVASFVFKMGHLWICGKL